MTLREKLKRRLAAIRRINARHPSPGDAFDHALIEVALAAEEFNYILQSMPIDCELTGALSRLDQALE